MKHKVKVFNSYDRTLLEEHMNEWLSENNNMAIVDIKCSSSQCGDRYGRYTDYSALIHYMEEWE